VARTIDLQQHAVRREAFVDTAARLIQTKGYERMSIHDVLDDLGTSRGAFYHYFDSKEVLLEAVVDRMADTVIGSLDSVLDDPAIPAPRKLELVFHTIGQYKAERRELVLAILEAWLSPENVLVREKFRRRTVVRITPALASIIRQGAREGTMSVDDPDDTALVATALIQGLNELAAELFAAHARGMASMTTIQDTYAAFTTALERVLGLQRHSLTLIDEATLRWWFD
jgi:AcrR family transcriptional regulator